ncbi:hypothetical protein DFQ28_011257 [Apophysomyces sp. BC1034]|nr:hypothetical protein DFQ30_007036 [Apophysomyces sp. BC1015]KAG0181470.1 hypothetical protein DFQ29_008252 [Apophysomyces sp. BC1021]KAG0194456.1 hypothetical protein DFQ28_011257 [Apophysomyces sp. BC1034]
MANNILDDLPLGTALDVIPAVAKRQAEEREREVRQIQEAEKAVQKAMERKAKIEQARMNAKKGVFARPEDATGSMRMNQGNQLSNSNYQEEKGKEDEEKEEDEKEEHLGVAQPNNVTVKEEEENCRSVHTVQAEQATPLSWARKPSLRHEEPRLSEPRLNEPRLNEPRPSEPRLSEPRLSEPRLSEPRLSEPRLNETRPSETRLSEPRLNEPWPSEPAHELYQPLPPPPASRRTYSTKRTSFLQPIAVGPLDNVMDSDYTKQSGNDVYEANERHTSCSCIIC